MFPVSRSATTLLVVVVVTDASNIAQNVFAARGFQLSPDAADPVDDARRGLPEELPLEDRADALLVVFGPRGESNEKEDLTI